MTFIIITNIFFHRYFPKKFKWFLRLKQLLYKNGSISDVERKTPNSGFNCLWCGKNSFVTDDFKGERFCSKCGFVIYEKTSTSGPEWSSFQKDDNTNSARTGAPSSILMHDMGLSTVINTANKDASGKPLSTSMKRTIKRLRIWNSRSYTHGKSDQNLRQALSELINLKHKLTISQNVLEKASYIYRKAMKRDLIRGRSISAMTAASLYAACRDVEAPRTLKEIAKAANVKRRDVAKCYRLLHRELELKMPVVDSTQCISRISSKLNIREKTKRDALKVLQEIQEQRESAGKEPMGLAASTLYLSCVKNGISITQRSVAEAAGVTEVTIRNRCKELKKKYSF